jgi:hypothetical protein
VPRVESVSEAAATVDQVSDLLPNLGALRDLLGKSSATNADALALVDAAATADTESQLSTAIGDAVEQWRRA